MHSRDQVPYTVMVASFDVFLENGPFFVIYWLCTNIITGLCFYIFYIYCANVYMLHEILFMKFVFQL